MNGQQRVPAAAGRPAATDAAATFLPVTLRIPATGILVIGGGHVATHKVLLLQRFTQRIRVVAQEVSDAIKTSGAAWEERPYAPDVLRGAHLIYICTSDHALNARIAADARRRHILANVCDAPALCDFVSPAIVRSGCLTVSVGSDAQDVRRSIRVRNRIKQLISDDILSID